MKKLMIVSILFLVLLVIPILAISCVRIKDGTLTYSAGHYLYPRPLKVGYDIFGYNYQGHMFNGYYCNAYLGGAGLPPYTGDINDYPSGDLSAFQSHWTYPYKDVWIVMKWNDAWLSNMDCDGDGKLDRYYGHDSYDGSGAWLTNHQKGTYEANGKTYKWTYFVKIVTPSTENGDYKSGGKWYDKDNNEIGSVIWGSFATVLQVYNDQGTGEHGVEYLSAVSPGFGYYN